MNDFSFELLKSPLYLSGCVASLLTLGVIRWADLRTNLRGSVSHFDRVRRMHTYVRQTCWQGRVRLGGEPLLSYGQPLTYRFINPKFLFSEVLLREPLSILPPAIGWLCVLLSEPQLGAEIIGGGLLWRVLWDWICLPEVWSSDQKAKTVCIKLTWCLATGVYVASIACLALAVVLGALVLLAFLGAGGTTSRRSKR